MFDRGERIIGSDEIDEILPPVQGHRERGGFGFMKVMICHLRGALGADSVETIRGHGYRLTPSGRAKIAAALGE